MVNSYEESIARLEAIVQKLEKGLVPLEESLELYKEGLQLIEVCDSQLKDIENQLTLIQGNGKEQLVSLEEL